MAGSPYWVTAGTRVRTVWHRRTASRYSASALVDIEYCDAARRRAIRDSDPVQTPKPPRKRLVKNVCRVDDGARFHLSDPIPLP